ncbi:hypothetical protein L1049_001963 [Liquidambar formosana]|uniref:IPO4/5-like TPR repeats domain-containing protein n=1 Tax=Liquidambar formosana TaxID=63359 RepID=A0AAP0NG74_LIQFO
MESRSSSEKRLRDEAFMLLTYKDPLSLATLVSHLTSPNNAQRSQAEMLFNCCKKEFADALCLTLARLLKDGPTTETRIRTVNLLRTILTHPESRIWPNLSEDVQTKLRSRFLAFYQHEISKPISKTLCRLVSEIATQIYEDGEEWPELLDFLLRSVQSDSHKVQESALLVFADFPECGQLLIVNVLMPHVHTLYSTFLNRFASPSLSVRIAAYGAAIGLTHLFIYSEVPDRFQQLLLGMMASLSQMLLCHEDYAQQGLEQLIVLVMREPQILRPRLRIVVDGMLKIAEDQRWKQKTKQYAVEFLIILAEARYQAPKMMRTLPRQYIVRLISIPVNILSFIEDDPAWHDVRNEEGVNAGKSIIYDNGMEWLSRLFNRPGWKYYCAHCFGVVTSILQCSRLAKASCGNYYPFCNCKGMLEGMFRAVPFYLCLAK